MPAKKSKSKVNNKKTPASVDLCSIDSFLKDYYRIPEIEDVSMNGIQFPGADKVKKIALSVDACLETLKEARKKKCQMLLCHHGMWWKGAMDRPVDRLFKDRLLELVNGDITLYGIHLPMDLHPESGHNARILETVEAVDLKPAFPFRGVNAGFTAKFAKPVTVKTVHKRLSKLGIDGRIFQFGNDKVRTVGVVSGGGAPDTTRAIAYGVDLYISGEFNHQAFHEAKEAGLNVIQGGHYATETPGLHAIGALLERQFGVETVFISSPTNL